LSRGLDSGLLGDRSGRYLCDLRCGLRRVLGRGLLGNRSLLGLGVFRLIVTTNSFVVGTAPHAVGLCIFN